MKIKSSLNFYFNTTFLNARGREGLNMFKVEVQINYFYLPEKGIKCVTGRKALKLKHCHRDHESNPSKN